MRIELDVQRAQLEAMRAELAAMRAAGEDPRAAFAAIVEDFLAMERGVFTSQGASIGARWEPIGARSTRSRTTRSRTVYRNPHPLISSGDLMRSLTSSHAKFAIRKVTRDGMTIGTKDPVAHLHDDGTPRKLPRRQLLKVDRAVENRWLGLLEDHLFGADRGLL